MDTWVVTNTVACTGVRVNAFDKHGTTAVVVAPKERQASRETAAAVLWAAGATVDARDPANGCTVRGTLRVIVTTTCK